MKPTTQVIDKPIASISQAYTFQGEALAKVAKGITMSDSIRFGVHLIAEGDTSKGRAAYVLADRANQCTTDKEAEAFTVALKAELINSAVDRTLALLPSDCDEGRKAIAKENATTEAKRRYDNIGQAIRAAKWALENPGKVADGVSVFTLAQANAYLTLTPPTPAKGETVASAKAIAEHAEKERIAKAVLPLLATPGTSQGAIKQAIAKEKDAIAKEADEAAKAGKPERTAEEQAEVERMMRERDLVARAASLLRFYGHLLNPELHHDRDALRKLQVTIGKPEEGTLASMIAELAKLAGYECKPMAAPASK